MMHPRRPARKVCGGPVGRCTVPGGVPSPRKALLQEIIQDGVGSDVRGLKRMVIVISASEGVDVVLANHTNVGRRVASDSSR